MRKIAGYRLTGNNMKGDNKEKCAKGNQGKYQDESYPGWDGVERRDKRERREKNRRGSDHQKHPETPEVLAKRRLKHDRREKERRINQRRKADRLRKEIERGEDTD